MVRWTKVETNGPGGHATVLNFSWATTWECLSVCLSGVRHFSKITALRILAKLGQKSKGDELGTVTRPDFPRKFYLTNYSWKQVLALLLVCKHFFWKTRVRIFTKLGMNVQHNKGKNHTQPFVREKSAENSWKSKKSKMSETVDSEVGRFYWLKLSPFDRTLQLVS